MELAKIKKIAAGVSAAAVAAFSLSGAVITAGAEEFSYTKDTAVVQSFNGAEVTFQFKPNADFEGSAVVKYTDKDGEEDLIEWDVTADATDEAVKLTVAGGVTTAVLTVDKDTVPAGIKSGEFLIESFGGKVELVKDSLKVGSAADAVAADAAAADAADAESAEIEADADAAAADPAEADAADTADDSADAADAAAADAPEGAKVAADTGAEDILPLAIGGAAIAVGAILIAKKRK